MAKITATSAPITLPRFRLSFARLFVPKAFQPGQDPRFEATFLGDPSNAAHKDTLKLLLKTASDLARLPTTEGGLGFTQAPYAVRQLAHVLLGAPAPDPKTQDGVKLDCLFDGNTKAYDGYAGMFALASHNKLRPAVVNRARGPVHEGDVQCPFSGCYVNGRITLWVQNNQYGKRINTNLRGVQFVEQGPAFGVQQPDGEEEFEALEDSEDGAAATTGSDDDDDWMK